MSSSFLSPEAAAFVSRAFRNCCNEMMSPGMENKTINTHCILIPPRYPVANLAFDPVGYCMHCMCSHAVRRPMVRGMLILKEGGRLPGCNCNFAAAFQFPSYRDNVRSGLWWCVGEKVH